MNIIQEYYNDIKGIKNNSIQVKDKKMFTTILMNPKNLLKLFRQNPNYFNIFVNKFVNNDNEIIRKAFDLIGFNYYFVVDIVKNLTAQEQQEIKKILMGIKEGKIQVDNNGYLKGNINIPLHLYKLAVYPKNGKKTLQYIYFNPKYYTNYLGIIINSKNPDKPIIITDNKLYKDEEDLGFIIKFLLALEKTLLTHNIVVDFNNINIDIPGITLLKPIEIVSKTISILKEQDIANINKSLNDLTNTKLPKSVGNKIKILKLDDMYILNSDIYIDDDIEYTREIDVVYKLFYGKSLHKLPYVKIINADKNNIKQVIKLLFKKVNEITDNISKKRLIINETLDKLSKLLQKYNEHLNNISLNEEKKYIDELGMDIVEYLNLLMKELNKNIANVLIIDILTDLLEKENINKEFVKQIIDKINEKYADEFNTQIGLIVIGEYLYYNIKPNQKIDKAIINAIKNDKQIYSFVMSFYKEYMKIKTIILQLLEVNPLYLLLILPQINFK